MKRITSGLLLLFVLCIISTPVLAVSVPTFISDKYVYDSDDILTSETEEKVNTMLVSLTKETTIEFLVYCTQTLGGLSPNEYATKAGNEWGIGKKDKDNGILLLVYAKGPNVYLATGYGMEETLTDRRCGYILDSFFVPYREVKDYDSAVINTVQAIINEVAKGQNIEGVDSNLELTEEKIAEMEKNEDRKNKIWMWIIIILVILIVIGAIIEANSSSGGYSGGSSGGGFGGGGGGLGGGSFGGGGAGR